MRSRSRLLSTIALAIALSASGTACMEERPAINEVQAGAVPKSFFVGADLASPTDDPEFLWRNYVVDASASQSLIGVGSYSGVDRVKWEITEDLLIARKAYSIAEGEDDKTSPDQAPEGTVVAAFAIESHFDIKRQYNPQTGEESNVVEENSRDSPWYSRKYMRIDWSKNLVQSPLWDDLLLGKIFGNLKITPATNDTTDPSSEDAPSFELADGYFDITTRYYVEPEDSHLIPGLPACVVLGLYTGSTTLECDAQEATVRSSFMRVDPNDDFEALEITKAPLDIVGSPAGIRSGSLIAGLTPGVKQGWDPGYGFTDALYHRYAPIHDIWKASHQKAACETNDDLDQNGTADACENGVTGYDGAQGSQCDAAVGKCTIPYRDREIKTVGYYLNPEVPADLQDTVDDNGKKKTEGAAEEVIDSWNQLLTGSVAEARAVECRRTGGTREQCEAEFLAPEKQMVKFGGWLVDKANDKADVLTTCHNPVREYDNHDACGETGLVARLGDIRKNFFAYWPYASRAPWGGIGNWGGDPQTGKIHGAAAMVMGRSATYAAAMQRDMIQVALGDISIEEITDGVPAENYAHQLQNGRSPQTFTQQAIADRIASIDPEAARDALSPAPLEGATAVDKLQSVAALERQASVATDSLSSSALQVDAYASVLRDTPYEASLVDDHWLVGASGLAPGSQSDASVLDLVSPLRQLDPSRVRALRHDLDAILESRGVCFLDSGAPIFGSVDIQGLAGYFRAKYPDGEYDSVSRGEAIYHDLWVESFKGIAIHEVGHSLGLLHNFASSWDAENFHPGYWQLRTHEGASSASCEGSPRAGDPDSVANDHCMGPRYLDPSTVDERGMADEPRPGIDYFGNSSVMEYPGERFDETLGVGQYDVHAMNALYGRVLETFDDAAHGGFDVDDQKQFAPRLQSQLTDFDLISRSTAPFKGQLFSKPTHYTEAARMMKVFDPARCRDATPEEKAIAGWRIVHGKVCAPMPHDHAAWIDFEDAPTEGTNEATAAVASRTRADAKTGGNMVRWFYRYGTGDNGYFHINPGDAGADPYEVTTNTIRKFDIRYPWSYFRRGDREYQSESLPAAVAGSTFARLRSYHWNVANRNAFYRSIGADVFDELAASDDWHRPALMAETEAFDAFARMLLMPQIGKYGKRADTMPSQERAIWDVSNLGSFTIGAVDGRFVDEEFDSDPDAGGSWDYQHWMVHAGFGVEKTYVAMALSDSTPVLSTINREAFLDGRDAHINFRSDMPEAMDRLIGGMLAEDWESVGMWVDTGSAEPTPKLLNLRDEDPTRPADARVLFPNIGYKQELGTVIFANLYSRVGGDMQLVNKMRIWMLGHDSAIEVPETQQVRFYDPASGYTYVGRRYGTDVVDGRAVDKGIASRMLKHANELLESSYQVEKNEDGSTKLDAFGAPILVTDADGQAIELTDGRKGDLDRYVQLLDAARQVGHRLGYGPIGGGAGE